VIDRIRDWRLAKEFKKMLKPNDRRFFPAIYQVNAFYNPSENSIGAFASKCQLLKGGIVVFLAGVLQAPIFHFDYPRAINYGGIGGAIGHEITHGFDDSGSQFDKFGNVQNWWEATARERFAERGKCMVEQYNQYKVRAIADGSVTVWRKCETMTNLIQVNGQLTLGENIADNGGLRAAYEVCMLSAT
jgi:predicted metalloendopeptidase